MKKLLFYSIIVLLVCWQCKRKEPVELPQCTCLDYETRADTVIYEGRIFFQLYTKYPYRIILDKCSMIPVYTYNGCRDYILVCEDSTIAQQIKKKQIKDSSLVSVKWNVVILGWRKQGISCAIEDIEEPSPVVRIIEIDKR